MSTALEDLYAVLQVHWLADADVIEAAFRRLARKYHPDTGAARDGEQMKRLNAAYAVLRDPMRRKEYDRERSKGPEPQPAPRPQPTAAKRAAPAAAAPSLAPSSVAADGLFVPYVCNKTGQRFRASLAPRAAHGKRKVSAFLPLAPGEDLPVEKPPGELQNALSFLARIARLLGLSGRLPTPPERELVGFHDVDWGAFSCPSCQAVRWIFLCVVCGYVYCPGGLPAKAKKRVCPMCQAVVRPAFPKHLKTPPSGGATLGSASGPAQPSRTRAVVVAFDGPVARS